MRLITLILFLAISIASPPAFGQNDGSVGSVDIEYETGFPAAGDEVKPLEVSSEAASEPAAIEANTENSFQDYMAEDEGSMLDIAEVSIGSKYSFPISESPGFTAAERADIVNRRIERILKDPSMKAEDIGVTMLKDGTPAVVLKDFTILAISHSDSRLHRSTQSEVAESLAANLKSQIKQLQPVYLRAEKLAVVRVLKEHRVLLLLLQVAILLAAAFACGELVTRIGQPKVIGQLLAGILLGPSALGAIAPELSGVVFPVEKAQSNLLEVVSWLGVIFLLMLSGMEVNLRLIWEQRKPAMGTAILGAIIPFMVGIGVAYLLPETLLVNTGERLPMAVYLGALFSVSSVPVVAKILIEMNLMQLPVGQITLTAALVQDIFGCFLIAVVAVLADSASGQGSSSLIKVTIGGIAFVIALIVFRKVLFSFLGWIRSNCSQEALLTVSIILLLLGAATTQYLGLHVVLGSFAVGLLLANSRSVDQKIIEPLHMMTMSVFAPIFFAAAGLNVNLTVLADPKLLATTILFSLVVCVAKIGSGYVGSRLGKLPHREALAVGVGTNTYGAMGLIFATIGFSLGLLTIDMYSIIVIMSLFTTACAPPLLHLILGATKQQAAIPNATEKSPADLIL